MCLGIYMWKVDKPEGLGYNEDIKYSLMYTMLKALKDTIIADHQADILNNKVI